MARPRGLYAGVGPGVTPSRDGVLLYGHLLGDLASHEAPIPHDITPRTESKQRRRRIHTHDTEE